MMLFTHLVERKGREEQKGGKVLETVYDGKGAGMAGYTGLGGGRYALQCRGCPNGTHTQTL